jgi:predicted RNA binding protein YcfA (HicA-like mRNA interferase family)
MSIVPQLPAHIIIRKLKRADFVIIHQRGSHAKLHNQASGRQVTVAVHPREFSTGALIRIIKQAGLTLKEFLDL